MTVIYCTSLVYRKRLSLLEDDHSSSPLRSQIYPSIHVAETAYFIFWRDYHPGANLALNTPRKGVWSLTSTLDFLKC